MELEVKKITKTVELEKVFNGCKLNYNFRHTDGKVEGGVNGNAILEDRTVMSKSTYDGISFSGNTWEQVEDDLSELSGEMKADLIAIFNNPETFLT